MKKYVVELTSEERRYLRDLARKGKAAAYKIRHANILLHVDQGDEGPAWKDAEVAEVFGCHETTVENVRRRLVLDGLDAAVTRRREGVGRPRTIDGDAEARLTVLACSKPPKDRSRWTLRLLADKIVELNIVDKCNRMTVQRTMKKTNLLMPM